jgi:hypothetical protein
VIPNAVPVIACARQEFEVNLRLTEDEARVLWALFCYGPEPVLEAALKSGTYYMQKVATYQTAFKSLGHKCYQTLGGQLERIDETRKVFDTFHNPLKP